MLRSLWAVEARVRPLKMDDASALAALHDTSFGRGWSEHEFEALMRKETVGGFLALARRSFRRERPAGFLLFQAVADEAEILSVAVDPAWRGLGIARRLLEATLRHLYTERVARLFLEVDERNVSAVTLYRRTGFEKVGERPAYYPGDENGKHKALIMRRLVA